MIEKTKFEENLDTASLKVISKIQSESKIPHLLLLSFKKQVMKFVVFLSIIAHLDTEIELRLSLKLSNSK